MPLGAVHRIRFYLLSCSQFQAAGTEIPRLFVKLFSMSNKLCSLIWDSYEAIVHACKKAWDFLINDPERIRSIGSRDWACVTL